MRTAILFTLGGACLPALGFAQSAPRLYVGASVGLVSPAPFESYSSSQVGLAATLGVQLTARWAIETGALATWRRSTYSYTFLTGGTTPDAYAFTFHSTPLLVPLLARYTFTAPSARLRVDALGGGYWNHTFLRTQQTITSNSRTTDTDYRDADNDFGVTLGPQLRYALGSRVEAKLNLPVSVRLGDYGDFGNRLLLTPQLGVQYTVGR